MAVAVIDLVVSPFDHSYESALLDVRVTNPPGQNDVGPLDEIVGTGPLAEVETVTGEETIDTPLEFVTRTVYDPALDTVMERVVCPPGLHKYEDPELAVSVTSLPGQNVVGPLAVIEAVARLVFGMYL